MTTLMIVESPSKAKKIGQMFGRDYRVVASVGHIRDMPPKSMGVAPPDFRPEYEPTDSGKSALTKLRKEMKDCDHILLATDPDREGEAIAWHLKEALRLSDSKIARVTYNSVTESAIRDAIRNAGKINMRLVAAQEARRVLDRLVGYTLSFPLSDAIGERASAGRVQTPTLMILAERDRAIAKFKPTKHFTAVLTTEPGFEATWNTKPFVTEDQPYVLDRSLAEKAAGVSSIIVDSYEQKKVARKPPAPFTTSVMQQAASAKLSMSAKDSMAAAQKLFENGLITYHRTDSTYLEPDSIKAIREVLKSKGLPVPDTPQSHKSKAGAQEAHEAIRPTDPSNDNPTGTLGPNERRLYALIHKQTLASQMANKIERVTTIKAHADVDGQRFEYQAKATEVLEKGYTALTGQGADDEPAVTLPKIEKGESIPVSEGKVVDKKTSAPPKFKEGSLIKELERLGIGRPSTWAAIIQNIFGKNCIRTDEQGVLCPDRVGLQSPSTGGGLSSRRTCPRAVSETANDPGNFVVPSETHF